MMKIMSKRDKMVGMKSMLSSPLVSSQRPNTELAAASTEQREFRVVVIPAWGGAGGAGTSVWVSEHQQRQYHQHKTAILHYKHCWGTHTNGKRKVNFYSERHFLFLETSQVRQFFFFYKALGETWKNVVSKPIISASKNKNWWKIPAFQQESFHWGEMIRFLKHTLGWIKMKVHYCSDSLEPLTYFCTELHYKLHHEIMIFKTEIHFESMKISQDEKSMETFWSLLETISNV